MSTKVTTPPFRASYPNLFKARLNELSNKSEFSVVALFPKDADLTPLKKAVQAAIEKKWGTDKKKLPKNIKLPFRDQAERMKEDENGKEYMPEGYTPGAVFMNLKSANQPGVVDSKVQPIIDETEIYAGCWMRASVNAYAYSQAGNNGVAFGLNHVQKVRDDKPLGGGRSRASDDFTALTEEESETAEDAFNV